MTKMKGRKEQMKQRPPRNAPLNREGVRKNLLF